jgi:hypothetical protein
MLKALFQDSLAGYLIIACIAGAIVTVGFWALFWKKKIDEERSGS